MNALDTILNIMQTSLPQAGLKYCLVDNIKRPFKADNSSVRVNNVDDFVGLTDLLSCTDFDRYAGVGVSIQASNICAIDVDGCFTTPNDMQSINDIGQQILDMFKDVAYCEYSFSGTGVRVLFRHQLVQDYNSKFYIKNSAYHLEFYQPSNSYRYVTVTGKSISDVNLNDCDVTDDLLYAFLNKYMKRAQTKPVRQTVTSFETRSEEECLAQIRVHLFRNSRFQDVWFTAAPGSGKDESERDFYLVSYLFENVTQDKNMLKKLFESSNFFKTKDMLHLKKWRANDNRYYNYLYELMLKRHSV